MKARLSQVTSELQILKPHEQEKHPEGIDYWKFRSFPNKYRDVKLQMNEPLPQPDSMRLMAQEKP